MSRAALVAIAVLAGCGPSVSVRSTRFPSAERLYAKWARSRPALRGHIQVATAGAAIYVVTCDQALRLGKLDARGRTEWTRTLEGRCPYEARLVAASEAGVVLVLQGAPEKHLLFYDATGMLRWRHRLLVDAQNLGVATARTGHSAVCFAAQGDATYDGTALTPGPGLVFVALEVDAQGRRLKNHVIDPLNDAGAVCSYDEDGALWLSARWQYGTRLTLDGSARSLTPGGWAIRLTDQPRFLPLFAGESTWTTPVSSGFVVHRYQQHVAFVDHAGKTLWNLPIENRGCRVSPQIVTASATRLLASLNIFCARRGRAGFADLEFQDHSDGDGPLGQRTVLVEIDTRARQALRVLGLSHAPDGIHYADSHHGVVAFGVFTDHLGLGTRVRSRPPTYDCLSNLPTDAQTWTRYESSRPRCKSGFHLKTRYPSWPFVALLPLAR